MGNRYRLTATDDDWVELPAASFEEARAKARAQALERNWSDADKWLDPSTDVVQLSMRQFQPAH